MGVLIGGIITAVEGIGSAIAGGVTAGAEALGISSGIATGIGTGVEGALAGAGLGAAEGAITGQDIGKAALFGGLSGGVVGGFGPELSALTGSTAVGDTLAGAVGGELGGLATGKQGIGSALEGAAGGFLTGALTGGAPATSAGAPGGGSISAAGTAAPAGVGGGAPDLALNDPGLGLGGGAGASLGAPSSGLNLTGGANLGTGAASGLNLGVTDPGAGAGALSVAGAGLSSGAGGGPTSTPSAVNAQLPGEIGTGAASGGLTTPGLGTTPGYTAPSGGGSLGGDITTGSTHIGPLTDAGANSVPSMTSPAGGGIHLGGLAKDLPLLALGGDLLKGNSMPPQFGALSKDAKALDAQGAQYRNYAATGTLPPGMQASLNAAGDSAAASIRSEYASRGMSGSSAEAQDLASLTQRIQAQGENFALQLFSQGVSETSAADQLYGELMQVQMQQDEQLSSSIGKLASSFALMGSPLQASGS